MSTLDTLHTLGRRLDETGPALADLDAYYTGTQPTSFLSAAAKTALGNRLRTLSVNYPRLAVTALAERLRVTGFRLDGAEHADTTLWRVWRANGLDDAAAQAHVDALVYGRSYVTVWAGRNGVPRVSVESAKQVTVQRDPGSREVTAAVKRWAADGTAYATVYEPDRITKYVSQASVVDGAGMPLTGWSVREVLGNPMGVVPVVPIVNRGRLLDLDGASEMADLLDLVDALNKLHSDLMVTSEFYARPRRYATGLEITEDDEGNVVDPFAAEDGKVWQSESPETKFGQFDASRLDNYGDAIATLTRELGALSGLPPHYLGLNGDQPPSADSIRSAEASLVGRAIDRQRTFGAAWAEVAKLIVAAGDGVDPAALDVETVWASPETRTPAQAADAAAKLAGIGLPLAALLADPLGMTPAQIDRILTLRDTEQADPYMQQMLTKLSTGPTTEGIAR